MAESPTQQAASEYWCYQCNRRVNGQTLDDNQVVCSECNDGFLVSIAPSTPAAEILQQTMLGLDIQNNERSGVRGGIDINRVALLTSRIRQMYRATVRYSGAGVVGNYGDYAEDAVFESILLNLADHGGNKGAPPAAESAVAALKDVKIESEDEAMLCVICKDLLSVGETAKELPCGHGYHGDCIGTWLATRNMCPVCRYELPTSDPDYEQERIKKISAAAGGSPKVPDE